MFQKTIDHDASHFFLADKGETHALLFVNKELMTGTQPVTPLWIAPCADEPSLDCMCRWAAARRHLWENWGELRALIGRDAFQRHMHELLTTEPPEHVVGAVILSGEHPGELLLGETLQGPHGVRNDILMRHVFASPKLRHAFNRWIQHADNNHLIPTLIGIGYGEGSETLGKLLDQLARSACSAAPDRVGRTRRRKAA
ncbi:hypothetical protein [Sphingomonas melonis]|uniref:Uncharacterized protein n=1 Tax=Sphingomonas melonis TaxID=152682 RepID=A0A7Y9FKZ0_9SPHN|nr:hypothetical protein [Sphingomonas melonis]NYD89199.1 hypothetical protein [Sphingomonas melonis]